jgi:DNA-binding LytR/AlgR family response regulator
MKVLLVEDEVIVRKDIEKSLTKNGHEVVGQTDNGDAAIQMARLAGPQIILMDIQIKGDKTGIETANEILKEVNLPIVFLTAYTDVDTLSKVKLANPYGYILKPFNETELCTTLELAQAHHAKERELKAENDMLKSFSSYKPGADHLFVKNNSRFMRLPNEEVFYVEALKDYMQIVTRNKTYVIHATMKDTERKMSNPDFQRVHRSFIVNMNHIEYISAGEITMKELGVKIPVGGLYKEKFAARINVL